MECAAWPCSFRIFVIVKAKKRKSSASTRSWPISGASSRGTKRSMGTRRKSTCASCCLSFSLGMTSILDRWRPSTCCRRTSIRRSRLAICSSRCWSTPTVT
uniref:(northern house mosquito) hypothetical protein n=1 Tax=Culex pipiens TaxID=7175 RepID=A0A8D7ZWK8_CULPI